MEEAVGNPAFWSAISALGAAAAAIVAAVQIKLGRADARRQAAFAHIREVEERLQRVWHHSVNEARTEALAFHTGRASDLTTQAADYLAYLSSLDLLLFACDTASIDRSIASRWLWSALRRDDEALQFVTDIQRACGDASCYEYLARHLQHARRTGVTVKTPEAE